MSARSFFNDATFTSQGLLFVPFSFTTNNTSDPDPTAFRGCGGLTGSAGATSVANSGPSCIASIARTGPGVFLVTFAEGYRYATCVLPSVSGGSGFTVDHEVPSNEGSGRTTALTLQLTVVDDEGVAAETTGRRVSCLVILKDSGNGT